MVCHRGRKQAETASPGCCIIQILNWVVLPHRENHQEDLGRKRQDPCGAYFKKIDSLITTEWSVRVDVARTLGSAGRNFKKQNIFSSVHGQQCHRSTNKFPWWGNQFPRENNPCPYYSLWQQNTELTSKGEKEKKNILIHSRPILLLYVPRGIFQLS